MAVKLDKAQKDMRKAINKMRDAYMLMRDHYQVNTAKRDEKGFVREYPDSWVSDAADVAEEAYRKMYGIYNFRLASGLAIMDK